MVIPFGRKRDNIYYLIGDKDVEKEKEGKIKILIGIKKKKKKKIRIKAKWKKKKENDRREILYTKVENQILKMNTPLFFYVTFAA